jgi:probable O-glycosylation ligase (exosortase A-associated)
MASLSQVLPARALLSGPGGARPSGAGSSNAAPSPGRDAAARQKPKNTAAFLLYLALVGIEYSGIAGQYPILKVLRIPTLVLFLTFFLAVKQYGGKLFSEYRETRLVSAWTAMTFLSIVWAVVRTHVVESMSPAFGNLIFCVAGAFVIDRRSRVMALAWLLGIIQIRMVLTNVDMLTSGERVGSFKGAYFSSDGNEYAWTINTIGPIILLLFTASKNFIAKGFALGAFALGLFAIVGTQSRGATLAIVPAGLIYLLFVARRKSLGFIAIAVAVVGILVLAPGAYFNRMGTIAHADDSSATLRIQAWTAATKMAIDFPLGAGAGNFNSAYGRYYIPENSPGYAGRRWINTHSVYFKVLGEFGFIGLGIFLGVIYTLMRNAYLLRQKIREDPSRYDCPESLPGLVMMSLAAWAVNGAFLSGFVYPHLFLVVAVGVGAMRMCNFEPNAVPAPGTVPLPRGKAPAAASSVAVSVSSSAGAPAAGAGRVLPGMLPVKPASRRIP